MLRFVTVGLGGGAIAGCARCGRHPSPASYASADEVGRRVREAAEAWSGGPGPNVELAGPEPLEHPALPTIVGSAMSAGVRRLRLFTAAGGFAAGENAAGAIAAGVRHVRFPLLAGSAAVHDALTGTPGSFDATLRGVAAFVEAARLADTTIHVTARVGVCRHNAHELPEAVAAAASAGSDEVLLTVEDGGLDVVPALPWVSSACATGVMNRVWVGVEGLPVCLLPGDELHAADVVEEREGVHGPRCRECAVRLVCPGGPPSASADTLASLAPPRDAERLARRIARAREGVRA